MITEVRKLQKSKTGYYINIPKNIAKSLQLTGEEVVCIGFEKDTNTMILDVLSVPTLNQNKK